MIRLGAVPAGQPEMAPRCPACGGTGTVRRVLDEADDFRISRGWVDCTQCGGTGKRRAVLGEEETGS